MPHKLLCLCLSCGRDFGSCEHALPLKQEERQTLEAAALHRSQTSLSRETPPPHAAVSHTRLFYSLRDVRAPAPNSSSLFSSRAAPGWGCWSQGVGKAAPQEMGSDSPEM